MLAEALGKGGIPSRLRADEDGRRCVRASHPRLPLSTELYAEWTDGQFWWLSEWGTRVCPADEVVSAVEYVWRLLAWGGENERPGGVGGNG
jgi:protein involved in temperature-dependent protein secretion